MEPTGQLAARRIPQVPTGPLKCSDVARKAPVGEGRLFPVPMPTQQLAFQLGSHFLVFNFLNSFTLQSSKTDAFAALLCHQDHHSPPNASNWAFLPRLINPSRPEISEQRLALTAGFVTRAGTLAGLPTQHPIRYHRPGSGTVGPQPTS